MYDFEENIYKLWYTGVDGLKQRIGYATSTNEINWTKLTNSVLDLTSIYNPKSVFAPFVIKEQDKYRMWFGITPIENSDYKIGYAESVDGLDWTILNPAQVSPDLIIDGNANLTPSIIKLSDTDYRMWYNMNKGSGWKIGYASSIDGLNWVKHVNNPVITNTQPWEGNDIAKIAIIHDGNVFHGWYDTNPPSNISYAYSNDGINWINPLNTILYSHLVVLVVLIHIELSLQVF